MLVHLTLAFLNRERVPVFIFSAAPIHGVEAYVTMGWHRRKQARMHGLALPRKCFFDRPFPLLGMRLNSTLRQRLVGLYAGLVKTKLDDGEIRGSRFKE